MYIAPRSNVSDYTPGVYILTPAKRSGYPITFTFFGVLLPLASVAVEVFMRGCSDLLFDPLPTVWHGLLAASVPIFNAFVYWKSGEHSAGRKTFLRFLNTIAIGSAIYFCIMFLPAVPIGLLGILALGLGLLVLGPYFGLIAAINCRRRLRSLDDSSGVQNKFRLRVPLFLAGLALPLMGLGGHDVRRAITLHNLAIAGKATTPADRASAITMLRQWGDEQAMLDACFGRASQRTFSGGWHLFSDPQDLDVAKSAVAYYRVNGRVPDDKAKDADWRPPSRHQFSIEWERWEEDQLRGGEEVGAPIAGLSLNASAITGALHADAATFYGEWVLEFRNDSDQPQEARCRLLLPEGGVVSRVSLWINGEEREAAYGPRGKVREAYQSVAVVQRRDPLLVTSCGQNRVMLQCFPVPAKGMIKTKIGISAPLRLNDHADRGLLTLPCLLEQNFTLADKERQHVVAIESGQPLETATPAATSLLRTVSSAAADGNTRYELAGTLPNDVLSTRVALAAVRRPSADIAFSEDPFDPQKRIVVQTVTATSRPPVTKLAIVVDGSAAMSAHWTDVCDAVAAVPSTVAVHGVIAADQLMETSPNTPGGAALAAMLRAYTPVGGQDAVPALQRALDLTGPGGVIIWLHAAQPVLLTSTAPLEARLSARHGLRVIDVPIGGGKNRVADALAQANVTNAAPWSGTLAATLKDAISAETSPTEGWRLDRELRPAAPTEPNVVRGNINLARLWAANEVGRLIRTDIPADRQAATSLAISHQLVTSVSGAVVLETKQQYDQNDLKAAMAVPLPPAIWAGLAMLVLVLVAQRRLRRTRTTER